MELQIVFTHPSLDQLFWIFDRFSTPIEGSNRVRQMSIVLVQSTDHLIGKSMHVTAPVTLWPRLTSSFILSQPHFELNHGETLKEFRKQIYMLMRCHHTDILKAQ